TIMNPFQPRLVRFAARSRANSRVNRKSQIVKIVSKTTQRLPVGWGRRPPCPRTGDQLPALGMPLGRRGGALVGSRGAITWAASACLENQRLNASPWRYWRSVAVYLGNSSLTFASLKGRRARR